MDRLKFLLSICLGLLLITACAPLPAPASVAPPTAAPWAPQVAAQAVLAQQLGIAAEAISLVSSEPAEWPDGCLGLTATDEMCIQVITPGYLIVLEAAGKEYVIHTDAAGRQARVARPSADDVFPEAAIAAQRVLSEQLGVELSRVRIISVVAVEWRDGCLGLAAPGEMCTMAIVPGYQVILEANGQQFTLHTDAGGSQVRAANLPAPKNFVPPAALRARAALADTLKLAPEAVRIISTEAVEWPDACLGIYLPDEACAQVVTPGHKVILEANGASYEYHTDATGDVLRLLTMAMESSGSLKWRGLTAEGCIQAHFEASSMTFGTCDGEQKTIPLSDLKYRTNQLEAFLQSYQSFSASTAAGTIEFLGVGIFRATPVDQRMLAEWADRAVAEAGEEDGLAMWGLGWHREGGVAGFCDDLTIDATGYVELAPCKYENPQAVNIRSLTADELTQLYDWLDTLAPLEFTQQDAATADGLTVRYFFAGRGVREATDADRQALAAFATEVLARWPAPIEVQTIQALADVDIHAGPGERYPVVGQVAAGQLATVTGIHPDGAWWRVICPDDTLGNCWVSGDLQLTTPAQQ